MTVSGDFIPSENGPDFDSRPTYQTLFGIPLTPTVSGILIAVLGLAAAIFLLVRFVQPALQVNQELNADIADKRQQLLNQEQAQQQIEEARQELAEVRQLQSDVLALFASEDSVSTLLLDLNERVQAVNAGIEDEDRRATLSLFEFDPEASGIVSDSSLGPGVNNRLQRRVFNVQLEGNFAQTQSIIRNIERLQPLLVLRDFDSELDLSQVVIELDPQGRLVQTGDPLTRITTSFQLNALLPAPESATPTPAVPAEGEAAPVEGEAAPAEAAN